MLKTVSSIANAIGALNYKGTWDASSNTPTLTSSVGIKGDYYVVSVAGTTTLNGISNWGVGDWATFNGSVWQRVEGGTSGNFVDLSATGITSITGTATINPANASTMDNVEIGNNTPKAAKFLTGTTVGNASGANTQFNINGVANKAGRIAFQETGVDQWLIGNGAASENGVFQIYDATNGTGVELAKNATSWAAISDERFKDIIEPITDAATKVASLRAVIGKYKTDPDGTRRSFLIAQDVQAVLPEAVDDTNLNKLGVRYTEIIPLLVAAIAELQAEILKLKGV
jgi:hypothetical protein